MPPTDLTDASNGPPPGSSAYYAFQRCAPPQRAGLIALLRFHVQVRAIVTTVSDLSVAQAKMAWWDAQLDAMEKGAAEHPTLRALGPFIQASGLTAGALRGVIESVQIDLQQNRWMDRPALLHYAKAGSGQTLRNSAALLGLAPPAARAAAEELGLGLRLASGIRNLGRDAAQGRIYLPLDALQRHGVTAAQLQQRRMDTGVLALLSEQTALARQTLEQALAGLAPFPHAQAAPLRALGAMALALLREIERADYAVLHQRISLTPLRKLWISRTCR
ncbi:MAG: squalene/phytoene synthase family protein [Thiomonas sp.]|nr:squalene/phytoene synthase family protein [Thiomonas sp.]